MWRFSHHAFFPVTRAKGKRKLTLFAVIAHYEHRVHMIGLLKRLFGRTKSNAGIETCSSEELRQIKEEADYLRAAVDASNGDLRTDDLQRLRRLTDTLNDINEAPKP